MAEQGLNIPEEIANVAAPIVTNIADKLVPDEKLPDTTPEEELIEPIPEENLIAQNDVVPEPEENINIKDEEEQKLSFVPKLKSASFKEEDPVVVAEKAGVWLNQYANKSGMFHPTIGPLKGKTAKEIVGVLERIERGIGESSSSIYLKDEFRKIADMELDKDFSVFDWIFESGNTLYDLNTEMYDGSMTALGDIYSNTLGTNTKWPTHISTKSFGGTASQITKYATQGAMSYQVGAVIAPAHFISKGVPFLKGIVNTRLAKASLTMGVGEAVTLPPEYRFATILKEDYGIDDDIINWLAAAPDEGWFMRHWKSFLEGNLVGITGEVAMVTLMAMGKGVWHSGAFAINSVKDTKLVKKAIKKIEAGKQEIIDRFPENIVSPEEVESQVSVWKKELQAQVEQETPKVKKKKTKKGEVAEPEVEDYGAEEVFTQTSTRKEREVLFDELAILQRGDPEIQMLKVQSLTGGGVLSMAVEHGGDLINRISKVFHKGGYEYAKDKIFKVHNVVTQGYGFEKEALENLTWWAKEHNIPFDKALKKLKKELKQFAKEHKKLPAYNESHRVIRDFNVAIGEWRFNDAKKIITRLKNKVDEGSESWNKWTLEGLEPKIIPEEKITIEITPEEFAVFILGKPDMKKRLGKVNLGKLDTADDIIRTIERLGQEYPKHIRVTTEQAQQAATLIREELSINGVDPTILLSTLSQKTDDLPYILLAARTVLIDVAEETAALARTLAPKVKVGRKITKKLSAATSSPTGEVVPVKTFEQELIDAGISTADRLLWATQLEKMHRVLGTLNGASTNVARTLRFHQIRAQASGLAPSPLQIEEAVQEVIEKTLKDAESMAPKGTSVEDVMDNLILSISDKTETSQITKQFAKSKFTRIFDIFNFHYINGLLSNLSTQAVNLTGTGTMTLLRTSEKYLAAGFNKLPGVGANVQAGEIGVTFTEAQLHTFGVTQALLEGAMFAESKSLLSRSAFGQAAKTFETLELGYKHELAAQGQQIITGGKTLNIGKLKLAVPEPMSPEAISEIIGQDVGKLGEKFGVPVVEELLKVYSIGVGLPGRALMAGDSFFRTLNYRAAIHSLSWRKAIEMSGEGATHSQIKATYRELIKNLPEEIDSAAQLYAQVSLFHQYLEPKGIEGLFSAIEKARRVTIDPGTKEYLLKTLGKNLGTSFLLQNIPFIRTLYNIQKQMLWERGPVRALRELSFVRSDLWKTDPVYRAETLAQISTGSMMMYLGYTAYQGVEGLFSDDEYKLELPSSDPIERDLAQEEYLQPPLVSKRNLTTGDLSYIPVGRADPLITSAVAGALIGLYFDLEAEIENADTTYERSRLESARNAEMAYQIGSFFTDKMALKGVKEILTHTGVFGNPYADPQKLINNYLTTWFNITPFSNVRKAITRANNNISQFRRSYLKEKVVEKEGSDIDYRDLEEQLPINLQGIRGADTDLKVEQISVIERLGNQWIDEKRKTMFIDTDVELDSTGRIKTAGRDLIKRGASWLVDLEGGLKGFTPLEVTKLKRWLEHILLPVSVRKAKETNTSVLIKGFGIKWEHPKRWTKLMIEGTGNHVPLTPEQQLIYALSAGHRNYDTFNTPEFDRLVWSFKTGKGKGGIRKTTDMFKMKAKIKGLLKRNKEKAAFDLLTHPEYQELEALVKEQRILNHPSVQEFKNLERSDNFLETLFQ